MIELTRPEEDCLRSAFSAYRAEMFKMEKVVGGAIADDHPVVILDTCFPVLKQGRLPEYITFGCNEMVGALDVICSRQIDNLKAGKELMIESSVISDGEPNAFDVRIDLCLLAFKNMKNLIVHAYGE